MARTKVTIELDRVRELRAGFNAICVIEEQAGVGFNQAMELLGFERDGDVRRMNAEKMHLRGLRLFLWAALVHEDPKLTQQDVGNLIDDAGQDKLAEIGRKVFEAWGPSWGAERGAERASGAGKEQSPHSPFSESHSSESRGASSGPSGDSTSA